MSQSAFEAELGSRIIFGLQRLLTVDQTLSHIRYFERHKLSLLLGRADDSQWLKASLLNNPLPRLQSMSEPKPLIDLVALFMGMVIKYEAMAALGQRIEFISVIQEVPDSIDNLCLIRQHAIFAVHKACVPHDGGIFRDEHTSGPRNFEQL